MVGLSKTPEPEDLAQRIQLIISGWGTRGVVADRFWIDIELLTQEPHHLHRYWLTRADQPAGITQGAKLEREAKPIVGPAPSRDHRQIVRTERVVADQIGLALRQSEQGVELSFGENAASRHGGNCPN